MSLAGAARLTPARHRVDYVRVKPFRFGVVVGSASSRAGWADTARKIEALGYSTLLMPDHLQEIFPPLVPLVSAADATSTLRVGTFVLNNDFRHPVLLAREAAAIDLLTDGRLELGLGAGYVRSEYEEAGIQFDPAPVRIERLGEAVRIIKGLLEGEATSLDGRHYRVAGHRGYPLPRQRPRLPILVGGNGPKLLALAAREADIVGLTGLGHRRGGREVDLAAFKPAAVDERVEWVRSAAGERFDRLELNALVQRVVVTDEPRRPAAELAAERPELSLEDAIETPYLLFGTVGQMVEALRARRERWGLSYYVVREPVADAFAPVVAQLAGT
jgi:probable F420-dependent oxidoreductase